MKLKLGMILVWGVTLASVASADMHVQKSAGPIAPTLAMAMNGGLVGNGGGTVVCRDTSGQIQTIELLDFYEARTLRNVNVDIKTIPGDWKAKAQAVINRIEAKSELHFQLYSMFLNSFESEDKLLANVEFSTVPDSGYIGVPRGCEFEQAAIQRKPDFSGDARYWINQELWNAMDDSQKAGLVLHEIIYREAIGYGHTDSIRTRFLTAMYASADFKTQTLPDYWKTLGQAHFETTDVVLPLAVKGTVTSWFDPTRVFQAGPDQVNLVHNIKLADELVVKVGDCSGDGCSVFKSTNLEVTDLLNWTVGRFALAKDLNGLNVGDTRFGSGGQSVSLNPGESLGAGMTPPFDGVGVYVTSQSQGMWTFEFLASSQNLLSPNSKSGHEAEGVKTLVLVKPLNLDWQWSGVSAKVVNEGESHPLPYESQYNPLAVGGDCMTVNVNYLNDVPHDADFSELSSCANPGTHYASVVDTFQNGIGFVAANALQAISFANSTPVHIAYAELPLSYSEWISPGLGGGAGVNISCDPSVVGACLSLTAGPNRLLTLAKIDATAVISFSCGSTGQGVPGAPAGTQVSYDQICLNIAKIKAGTSLDFYSDGVPKSFVLANPASIYAGTTGFAANTPAGATIELDQNGFVTSIH